MMSDLVCSMWVCFLQFSVLLRCALQPSQHNSCAVDSLRFPVPLEHCDHWPDLLAGYERYGSPMSPCLRQYKIKDITCDHSLPGIQRHDRLRRWYRQVVQSMVTQSGLFTKTLGRVICQFGPSQLPFMEILCSLPALSEKGNARHMLHQSCRLYCQRWFWLRVMLLSKMP